MVKKLKEREIQRVNQEAYTQYKLQGLESFKNKVCNVWDNFLIVIMVIIFLINGVFWGWIYTAWYNNTCSFPLSCSFLKVFTIVTMMFLTLIFTSYIVIFIINKLRYKKIH